MHYKSQSKKSGFATISLLLFLPIICLTLFCFSFSSYLIQFKTQMRSTCILDSIGYQNKLIKNIESLFKLNPLSLSLTTSLKIKKAERIAALASENFVLAAQLEIQIQQIITQQQKLDLVQKKIIQKTQFEIHEQSHLILENLNRTSQTLNSNWNFYIKSLTSIRLAKTSQLAIKAESSELAPVYELAEDYIEVQRLAFIWHHFYQTQQHSQDYLFDKNKIEMTCGAEARKEVSTWTILINGDKF